jgi:hypothetical protein
MAMKTPTMHVHIHSSFIHNPPAPGLDPVLRTHFDDQFLKWNHRIKLPPGKLLTVSTEGLWEQYLATFASPDLRQYHNCNECRRFIERFGGIVTVDEKGKTVSLMWDRTFETNCSTYALANEQLRNMVESRPVAGVFLSGEHKLGVAKTGVWDHFSVNNPSPVDVRVKTAEQQAAEKCEDFRVVNTALDRWTSDTMHRAVTLLKGDDLYRSGKVLPQAQWLFNLRVAVSRHKKARNNIVWKAVAEAPAGFCHPTSGMLGVLLDDISSGMAWDAVSRRFAEKMNPLQYQRPQAAPAAQTVKQAEDLFTKLGLVSALQRRYLRHYQVPMFWRPRRDPVVISPAPSGIFATVNPKVASRPSAPREFPGVTDTTWTKFEKQVLPTATKMELFVNDRDAFVGLATANDEQAPLLFQWNHPASWWFMNGGTFAREVNVAGNRFAEVEGLARHVHEWGSVTPVGSFPPGVFFALKGAKSVPATGGVAIFPECLRSELHGVRSVIEAFSKKARMGGVSDVGGILYAKGDGTQRLVRVTAGGLVRTYRIDRWD